MLAYFRICESSWKTITEKEGIKGWRERMRARLWASLFIFEERRSIQDHLPIQLRKVSALSQQVLLPDRVMRRKVQRIRYNKERLGRLSRSCASYILCQASLFKSTASYLLISGQKLEEIRRKLIQQSCKRWMHRLSQSHHITST